MNTPLTDTLLTDTLLTDREEQSVKSQLVDIFRETLRRLDLATRMSARIHCQRDVLAIGEDLYDLSAYERLQVLAIGKAAPEMAAAFDTAVGRGRATGIVVPPHACVAPLGNFRCIPGGHPYPNQGSMQAAHAVLNMLRAAGEESLIVFLISGGGSAVFEAPLWNDISLQDCRRLYETLVTCGANIYEMNTVRKHFSAVKGGRLAVAAWPARQVTLYVSDAPAGRDSTVASGPSMPDESTVAECREIIARYRMSLPASYQREIPETPKPGDGYFDRSRYLALLSNQDGVEALAELACGCGWFVTRDTSCDDWPLERAADHLLARLRAMEGTPACVVSGGELSCPVTGQGTGGRNQAFALYCAMQIAGERIAVLSAGTDGADGNSPAAGAVSGGETCRRTDLDARDFYARSDSYSFFAPLGDAIVTGPTGNNVRDLRLLVKY
jgi:glycerate 2-kinase